MRVSIAAAHGSLSALIDQARQDPILLMRGNRAVAAIVDVEAFERLRTDSEELADIRAADSVWEGARRRGDTPVPWDDVKREIGRA